MRAKKKRVIAYKEFSSIRNSRGWGTVDSPDHVASQGHSQTQPCGYLPSNYGVANNNHVDNRQRMSETPVTAVKAPEKTHTRYISHIQTNRRFINTLFVLWIIPEATQPALPLRCYCGSSPVSSHMLSFISFANAASLFMRVITLFFAEIIVAWSRLNCFPIFLSDRSVSSQVR